MHKNNYGGSRACIRVTLPNEIVGLKPGWGKVKAFYDYSGALLCPGQESGKCFFGSLGHFCYEHGVLLMFLIWRRRPFGSLLINKLAQARQSRFLLILTEDMHSNRIIKEPFFPTCSRFR